MADIKFTGVDYDYGNITIQIATDALSVSALASSGIVIGEAKDYDRIASLSPTVCKIKDGVSDVYNIGCPILSASAITIGASSKTYTLKKDGDLLNCKVTS